MGRTIFAEESLEKSVRRLFEENEWCIGLIIGQQTAQRDYVVHMVRTPQQEPSLDDSASGMASQHSRLAPPKTLETVDDIWVVTHARQVLKMLPGGLDIIGVFAMATPDVMTAIQMKLKQILFSVHKMTQKASAWTRCENDVTERIFLQICPTTRKLTCRTFDVADNKGIAKPADWKYQSFMDRWHTVTTSVRTDLTFHIPIDVMCQSLLKQIQSGLSAYCRSIWDSVVTLNNKVFADNSLLDTAPAVTGAGKKGKKHKETSEDSRKHFYAEMFMQLVGNSINGTVKNVECGGLMVLRGTMSCRAYLNNKATFKDATNAIKKDVIRSLLSRCELLCEDFAAQEEEQYDKVIMETPKRIFAPLSTSSPVCFCDYAFPDEKLFESKERFRDLTDLHIKEDQLDDQSETLPSNEDLMEAENIQDSSHQQLKKDLSIRKTAKNILGLVMGGAVAALAAGVSLIYLNQE